MKPTTLRNRLRGERKLRLRCPYCGLVETVTVLLNLHNYQQSGGPRLSVWSLVGSDGSRVLSVHECPGEAAAGEVQSNG